MLEVDAGLSGEDADRLARGLPDLADWGPNMLVPFEARQLRAATVVWLNPRWFLERGVDITKPATRARIDAWLIEEFAYLVPQANDSSEGYNGRCKVFHADRYGGSGLEAHGGSGRAAINGVFQVKGIGATPLVGEVDEWAYSHGCVWLEEAIREAIYAEVAAAEFPHGAVPVVAILDTGLCYTYPDGRPGERRALLVRPAVVRIAHLQRATMFRTAPGTPDATSSSDATRVRDAIHQYERIRRDTDLPYAVAADIETLFRAFSDQIAYGRMQRLYLGGYFSSNLALTGEILDFGSMRAVCDWSKAYANDHVPALGEEFHHIATALESLLFFYRKYALSDSRDIDSQALLASLAARVSERCDLECLRIWGIADLRDTSLRRKVLEATQLYFHQQQRVQVSYQNAWRPRQGWLYDAMLVAENGTPEANTLHAVERAWRAHFGDTAVGKARRNASRQNALRLLKPRRELDRELLQIWLYDMLGGDKGALAPEPAMVAKAIDDRISLGRRHWPHISPDYIVEGQRSDHGNDMLLCREVQTANQFIWIEAVRSGSYVRLFDRWIAEGDLLQEKVSASDRRWRGRFLVLQEQEQAPCIYIAGRWLEAPAMSLIYP